MIYHHIWLVQQYAPLINESDWGITVVFMNPSGPLVILEYADQKIHNVCLVTATRSTSAVVPFFFTLQYCRQLSKLKAYSATITSWQRFPPCTVPLSARYLAVDQSACPAQVPVLYPASTMCFFNFLEIIETISNKPLQNRCLNPGTW